MFYLVILTTFEKKEDYLFKNLRLTLPYMSLEFQEIKATQKVSEFQYSEILEF